MGMDPVMVLCQTRVHRPQLGWSQGGLLPLYYAYIVYSVHALRVVG